MNKYTITGIIVVALAIVGVFIYNAGDLGFALPYNTNSTGTIVTVGNVVTEVLPAKSGRTYFRITNLSTSTFTCVISSSTAGMVVNSGIILNPSTSTNSYLDSGISDIEWEGAISCISSVTGTMATFEK